MTECGLGVRATVVMDSETHGPRTVEIKEVKRDWHDFGVGFLDDIDIVSAWTLEVAVYALQNPTAENIAHALAMIGASGDCEDCIDEHTLLPLLLRPPEGWPS